MAGMTQGGIDDLIRRISLEIKGAKSERAKELKHDDLLSTTAIEAWIEGAEWVRRILVEKSRER